MTQKDDSDIDDPILKDNPKPVNGKRKRATPLKNCPLLDQTADSDTDDYDHMDIQQNTKSKRGRG